MPTSPARLCDHCGRRLQVGERCPVCRAAWVKRRESTPLGLSWPALRRKVLDRDRELCRLCGQRATHVDHIVPRSEGGQNTMSNLRALCDYCHSKVTGRHARAARDRTVY